MITGTDTGGAPAPATKPAKPPTETGNPADPVLRLFAEFETVGAQQRRLESEAKAIEEKREASCQPDLGATDLAGIRKRMAALEEQATRLADTITQTTATTPAGAQAKRQVSDTPGQETSSPADDPAVIACAAYEAALDIFNTAPCATPSEEESPVYQNAEKAFLKADQAFAEAPVFSLDGALTKMRYIAESFTNPRLGRERIEPEHVVTVLVFLERLATAPPPQPPAPVVADPLPAMWEERQTKWARIHALTDGTSDKPGPEEAQLHDEVWALERHIVDTQAPTLAGLAVQARLMTEYIQAHDYKDGRDEDLVNNIAAAVERFAVHETSDTAPPAPGLPHPNPDARIIALDKERTQAKAEHARAATIADQSTIDNGRDHPEAHRLEELSDAAFDRWIALEKRVVVEPAQTFLGLAIKLRLATDDFCPKEESLDITIFRSALADAERLAGEVPPPSDQTTDPALIATAILVALDADFKAAGAKHGEESPPWREAEKKMLDAFGDFLAAEITTTAGAVAVVEYSLNGIGTLDNGQMKALLKFFKGLAEGGTAPSTPATDPVLIAEAKYRKAEAALNKAYEGDDTSPEAKVAEDALSETGNAFLKTPATTPAGALAQARELGTRMAEEDPDGALLTTNAAASVRGFLERLAGGTS